MKTHWGAEVQLHVFLTSELDGGEWSASRPDRFTPGWVGVRTGLDAVAKRNTKYFSVIKSRRMDETRSTMEE
jgi:hypothetical protein